MLKQINLLLKNEKNLIEFLKSFLLSVIDIQTNFIFMKLLDFLIRKKCKFSDLELKEIINILKTSSKKNSARIYFKNVLEVNREYFKNLNVLKIFNFLNIFFIAMIYLILTIKKNAKKYK